MTLYEFVEWFGEKHHLPGSLLLGAKRCALRSDVSGMKASLESALREAADNRRDNQAVLDSWVKESNLRIYVDDDFAKMTGIGA